ncbi:MAG TPA: cation diffusion facilitator family transporter [Bacteroidales bacterium]|nr:cation diffusion facilitator family transporter [Bacteroidales bacterium]
MSLDSHHHHHDHAGTGTKNIALAFYLNLFFCVIELVGGILTNSVAILSDALHDLGDSVSLGMAWYFQKISKKKPDGKYTYGYKRFSILSALLNSLILLSGSCIVLYASLIRLFNPVHSNAKGMLLLALFGMLVNGFAAIRLKKGGSLNERVVSLHLLEDVLGWFAVLITSIVMIFTDLPILDPILSIGIACFILYNVYHNLRKAFRVILQGKPEEVDEADLRNSLLQLGSVKGLHDLHIWTMDSEFLVLTVHLVLVDSTTEYERQALRAAAHEILKTKGIQHATIEMELATEICEWCEAR